MKKSIAIFLVVSLLVCLFGCDTVSGNTQTGILSPGPEPMIHEHGQVLAYDKAIQDAVDSTGNDFVESTQPATESVQLPMGAAEEVPETFPTEVLPETTEPLETEHIHAFTSAVFPPSCETEGYTKYTCVCDYSYTCDEKPATGHNYKTTTVASTKDCQSYDLNTCSKCGHSYKDNYKDSLPEENEHTGMYYDDGSGKWAAWSCGSQGHHWCYTTSDWNKYKSRIIRQESCTQPRIVEYYCDVEGCGESEQRETPNSYADHHRSTDTMTGLVHKWQVRMISGGSFYYHSEEAMKANVRSLVNEYKNGERRDWVEYIREYYTATFTDTYVCQTCGQTLDNNSRYKWVGEPRYKGYDIYLKRYTKYNQPDF